MPRRKDLGPDTRLDWRDPNMPCLVVSKTEGQIYIEPKRLSKVADHRLHFAGEPNWRDDPTYNMRKSKP